MASRKRLFVTFALLLAALLIGLPSLTYPLGRDQGVYFYVAREWLHHGAVPYRDLFDHKPPGIYVIYAIAIAIFRGQIWGIRVLELGAIAMSGWLAARLSRARDQENSSAPSAAIVILVASCLYFGFLNFWDTAQCELWCLVTALGAAYCGTKPGARWLIASGALASCAVVIKLPAVVFVAPIWWFAWQAGGDRRARARSWFVGALVIPAIAATYFAANGALGKAIDIIFGANVYYASHEHIEGVSDAITRLLDVFRLFMPFSLVLAYGMLGLPFLGKRFRTERLGVLLWTVAGLLGVAIQLKFYTFHFVLLLAPALLATGLITRAVEDWTTSRGSSVARARGIIGANVIVLFLLSWQGEHLWFATARDALFVQTGQRPRQDLVAHFTLKYADFDEGANEQVAVWIQAHSAPDDVVCMRRFEPEVYALSDRACSSPFFWTYWLTEPSRAYRREEYLEEDRNALERSRPKIIATRQESREGAIDDASYAEQLGYVRSAEIGPYILMTDGRSIVTVR